MAFSFGGKEVAYTKLFSGLLIASFITFGIVAFFTYNFQISWSQSMSILLTRKLIREKYSGSKSQSPEYNLVEEKTSLFNATIFLSNLENVTKIEVLTTAGKEKNGSASQTLKADVPILTIFTSFKNSITRKQIHTNVLYNWAQFIPQVRPILYDSDTDRSLIELAKKLGWIVLQVPRKNQQGTPFVKEMYITAKEVSTSVFYGFSNGDLLFTEGLVDTLSSVSVVLDKLNETMIIGRRTNFNIKNREIYKSQDVAKLAKVEGKLFRLDAEDYFFIAHNSFPWKRVPSVVIGRPAYDNFLVGTAIRWHVSVVDATETLLALHQTGSDGNYAGHKNKDAGHNSKAIGRFNYNTGLTTSAQYMTKFNSDHRIDIFQRGKKKSLIKVVPTLHNHENYGIETTTVISNSNIPTTNGTKLNDTIIFRGVRTYPTAATTPI